jgi:thioesterase domain-containing protein
LQLEKLGTDDNFFDIGGHSLLAGRVISQIHQITGRLLPLSAIFAHPTIARLAILLNEDSRNQVWNTLVPIRKTGSRPPLYCIHPISGDVEYVYKLIPYLDEQQPVYGLLAEGINGVDAPFGTVEEAAAAYVEQILSRHQSGPVHLAGYSYGGFVAYEMAQQLTARGYRVENLILFDTYPNNAGRTYRHYALPFVLLSALRLITSFQNIRDYFRNQYWRSVPKKMETAAKLIGSRTGLYRCNQSFFEVSEAETALGDKIRLRLSQVLGNAILNYHIRPYPGKVVFIRAMEGAARYLAQSDFGWKKNVNGPLEIHDIPHVGHFTIFENDYHVKAVANLLNAHLCTNQPPPDKQTQADSIWQPGEKVASFQP